jgi:epoxyqueuosine reductase
MITLEELRGLALKQGFQRVRLLASRDLPADLAADEQVAALGKGSYLLCALSCYRAEPEDLSAPGEPHGLIAPFARRNYYREAVARLKQVALTVRQKTGLAKRQLRLFSNSRLPEKALGAACGLGFYGRNSLLIAPELGSLFVIAGLFLPLELPGRGDRPPREWRELGRMCGSCSACADSCPVSALKRPGVPDRARCLQELAGRALPFPEQARRAWDSRLYGCQTCQDCCPFNAGLKAESDCRYGRLGPSLPLKEVLVCSPEAVKAMFRGTQMGLSWVAGEAILRNALLAAGNRADPVLRPLLERHAQADSPLLREAARWAPAGMRPEDKTRG